MTGLGDEPSPGALRWGVVGGGMLGLTLAHRLAQQGHAVTIIEGATQLGGLASAWRLDEIVWDRHYHVTLLSDSHLRGILRELGLEDEMRWVETRTGCFADGKLYSVSDTLELLKFPVLSLWEKLRLGLTILYASRIRDGQRLERVLVSDWLIRWSGRRTFERFWLPLLRSKLGESYRETSASFIWAVIARLYAARSAGLKKEMFGYVPGGYARVLDRFAEHLCTEGVEIELGRRVEHIESTESSENSDGSIAVRLDDGSLRSFDRVVVTLATPLAARVCRELDDDERRKLERIRYQGIVCASVLLERPLADYYVTNILDEDVPFTGVIEMSTLVDREQFGGKSLVYLPRYLVEGDPIFDLPDAELEELFLGALERMYPAFRRSDVVCFQVSRVRQVLALSTLDYSNGLPSMQTSVPGLYVVNSAQIVNGTLNVNETIQLAERAIDVLH